MSRSSYGHTIVIATAADAAFAMPMAVSLFSALRHLPREREVRIYVIDDGIHPRDRRRCARIIARAHPAVTLDWVSADATQFKGFKTSERYSRAVYLRLMLAEIVPERYPRVLYLDSDVVVARDLSVLWSLDLGAHAYWAVENFWPPQLARVLPWLFPPPEALYHNAGVLLVNMPQWRKQRIADRAMAFLRQYSKRLHWGDQDALNAVLKGGWGQLDHLWNVQLFSLKEYRKNEPHSRRLQDELLASSGILHYSGGRKPWHWRYRGPAEGTYFRTLLASGWFGPLQGRLWITTRVLSHAAFRALSYSKRISLHVIHSQEPRLRSS